MCGFSNVSVCVCVDFVMCFVCLRGFCTVMLCVCVGFEICCSVYVWVI